MTDAVLGGRRTCGAVPVLAGMVLATVLFNSAAASELLRFRLIGGGLGTPPLYEGVENGRPERGFAKSFDYEFEAGELAFGFPFERERFFVGIKAYEFFPTAIWNEFGVPLSLYTYWLPREYAPPVHGTPTCYAFLGLCPFVRCVDAGVAVGWTYWAANPEFKLSMLNQFSGPSWFGTVSLKFTFGIGGWHRIELPQ